jgi:sec-independent protein translocase protein TatA
MPGFIGMPELIVLGIVLLLIFGPKRLPEMGRSMGRGMREFKESISGEHRDEHVEPAMVPVVVADDLAAVPATPLVVRDEERVA